jgi:demethylmenaquinone methyltransferase / 2-methoxy-6-polyprenyl-1,4-benzoquinol methylase
MAGANPMAIAEVRPGSGRMFDRIARRYDLLNRLLSLGLDQRWRRRTVSALELRPGQRVLDLATGTGDLALAMLRACPGLEVIGLDPSVAMLARAREKGAPPGRPRTPENQAFGGGAPPGRPRTPENQALGRVFGGGAGLRLGVGVAEELPFADGSFDRLAIAFGLRNVPDRERALREMARVTRPGGIIAILELGEPRGWLLGRLAWFHVHVLVPRIGALLSGAREYRYLEKSIAAFPPPDEVLAMMQRSGIERAEARPQIFGVCHLFVGRSGGKPC